EIKQVSHQTSIARCFLVAISARNGPGLLRRGGLAAAPLKPWDSVVGPLLLFLGLLTLLNAKARINERQEIGPPASEFESAPQPFDWASLGLTRALLAGEDRPAGHRVAQASFHRLAARGTESLQYGPDPEP